MKLQPAIDQEFKYASPFLKQVTAQYGGEFAGQHCLDIPSGNGRNTFLLAGYFKKVTAVDINEKYLQAIYRNQPRYETPGRITTLQSDILINPPGNINQYQMICNIHYFHATLIESLLKSMRRNALLLVETPGCNGRNYEILPAKAEIDELFAGHAILQTEFKICKHIDNTAQHGALKILIRT
jgi:SAM-dependent methyltransferase